MKQWHKLGLILAIGIVLKLIINLFDQPSSITLGDRIRILLRQSSRWAVAAEQDKSPISALLHANYGAGFLWALMDIATEEEINKAADIDLVKFKQKILRIQDKATKKVSRECPDFAKHIDKELAKIGGDM